jgi:hypothetical protein
MSLLSKVRRLFGQPASDDDGTETLRRLIQEREATLNLTAAYGQPYANTTDEPTAVFPYTVFADGDVYSTGRKEFPIPNDGLTEDSALTAFVANVTGADEVTFETLLAVEGETAEATLTEGGDIIVGRGVPPRSSGPESEATAPEGDGA